MKKILLILIFTPTLIQAQIIGGERTMEFLRLSQSAHVTAMGGYCVNNPSKDFSLASANPALLNEGYNKSLSFNFNSFYAGSKFYAMQYALHQKSIATTFSGGIQYLNYGKFTQTDIYGNALGNIIASDFAISVSASRAYSEKVQYGATLKYASSQLATNNAKALLADIGVTYSDTSSGWYVGGVFKNVGVNLKNYIPGNYQPLPFDVQIGVMKKFKKAPFSLMMLGHHLYTWDIRYDNPADQVNNQLLFGDTSTTKAKNYTIDKIFRHINFGVGLNLGKRLEVNVAYNHLRRSELAISEKKGMSGFSMGAAFHLNKFLINYARSYYHIAGAQNEIGFNMNLHQLFGL